MTAAAALFAVSAIPVGKLAIGAPEAGVAASGAFERMSHLITGHDALDAALRARLFDAFVAIHPGFEADVVALAAFVEQRKLDGASLQAALDDAKAKFAGLPRLIARGWYVGIVEKGADAQCVAYATSLAQVAVADHIRPPTYAYGAYGTWANKPA